MTKNEKKNANTATFAFVALVWIAALLGSGYWMAWIGAMILTGGGGDVMAIIVLYLPPAIALAVAWLITKSLLWFGRAKDD